METHKGGVLQNSQTIVECKGGTCLGGNALFVAPIS